MQPNGHVVHYVMWQDLEKTSQSSTSIQLLEASLFIRVWLPHLEQRLRVERKYGNTDDYFVIAVKKHSDTRAADDKAIVGH